MLAAIAQLVSTAAPAANTAVCKSLIQRASSVGAKIIYLPEAADFIAPSNQVFSLTLPLEKSTFVSSICTEARQSKIWVGVGVHESSEDPSRIYNSHLLIDSDGVIQANYRKLHLFDVDIKGGMKIKESNTTIPGRSIVDPVNSPVGNIGLLTCYDLRFPEQSLLLRKAGAQILTYPSAFTPKTGEAHWESLLRARAIETQCYVFAPAQGPGEHFSSTIIQDDKHASKQLINPGRASYGNAMLIDPYGTIIARCPSSSSNADQGQLCFADIDLEWLDRIRTEMPLWDQRRNDIYNLSSK